MVINQSSKGQFILSVCPPTDPSTTIRNIYMDMIDMSACLLDVFECETVNKIQQYVQLLHKNSVGKYTQTWKI